MALQEDIDNLMDRVPMGFDLAFYYKGKPYFMGVNSGEKGNGPAVSPHIRNEADPIFTLPPDRSVCDLLDEFKIDGKSIRELLPSDDLVIESIW